MRVWFTTGAADGHGVVGTAHDHTAVPLDVTDPARAEAAVAAAVAAVVDNASRGPLRAVTSAEPPPRIRLGADSVAGVEALVRQEPNAWRGRTLSTGHTG